MSDHASAKAPKGGPHRWAHDRLRDGSVTGGLAARALLLLLADYKEGSTFPKVSTLAKELDCSVRFVQRGIASLVADKLIERELRFADSGRSTSSEYVLKLTTWGTDALERGDCQAPGRVSNRQGEGAPQTPPTSFEPPNLTAASPDGLALSEVRARDRKRRGDDDRAEERDRAEAAYRLLEEHWLRLAPGRVAEAEARMAFSAAWASGVDPALLAACGLKFLAESRDAKAGMIPRLETWLKKRLWRGFEPAKVASGPVPSPSAAAVASVFGSWRGADPAFVEAVEAARPPAWIASWLTGCGWDAAERAIVAPLGMRADNIRRDLGGLLKRHEIGVVVRRAETARAA